MNYTPRFGDMDSSEQGRSWRSFGGGSFGSNYEYLSIISVWWQTGVCGVEEH